MNTHDLTRKMDAVFREWEDSLRMVSPQSEWRIWTILHDWVWLLAKMYAIAELRYSFN